MFRHKLSAAVAAGLLIVAGAMSACSSAQLTDAREILSKAQGALDSLKSVHFRLEAVGQAIYGVDIVVDSPSPSPSESPSASPSESPSTSPTAEASATASPTPTPPPTPTPTPTPAPTTVISLDGTYAEGDLDIANKNAHFQGSAPGLPGFAGEILETGAFVYIRLPGQTKYTMQGSSELSIDPVNTTTGPVGIVRSILKVAADKRLQPELIGIESPLGESCYHIRVTVTPEVVNERLGLSGTAVTSGTLDLWIQEGSFNLQVLQFKSSSPTGGSVAIRLILTNFNAVAAIEPPPAEQFEIPALQSQGY